MAEITTRVFRADGRAVAWLARAAEYSLIVVRGDDSTWRTIAPHDASWAYKRQRRLEYRFAIVKLAKLVREGKLTTAEWDRLVSLCKRISNDASLKTDSADAETVRTHVPDAFPSIGRWWLAFSPKYETAFGPFYKVDAGHLSLVGGDPDLADAVSHQTMFDAIVATRFGGVLPDVAPTDTKESRPVLTIETAATSSWR